MSIRENPSDRRESRRIQLHVPLAVKPLSGNEAWANQLLAVREKLDVAFDALEESPTTDVMILLRQQLDLAMTVNGAEQDSAEQTEIGLSADAIDFVTDQQWAPGTQLHLFMVLPGSEALTLQATVSRCINDESGIIRAVAAFRLSPRHAIQRLRRFLLTYNPH